ncbi:hypothetical protein BH24ACT7_BH24ACT7_09890 [soil metagenome]
MAVATAADWTDPLHRGVTSESDTVSVFATTAGGHDLVIGIMSPLHAWGIVGDAMIAIEGNVLPDTLASAVDQVLPPR